MTVILRSHNLTNETKNATDHSEINCINSIYKYNKKKLQEICKNEKNDKDANEILENCVLFVSCEPCIMCAYALSQISKINYDYY